MKKLLALVLALVMTLGLATVGANAAVSDYKDADSIKYEEAAAIMQAIGVMVGDTNGNFNANETLKRSEAAKILAYLMLGNKAADALQGTGKKFPDVAANAWYAGYVEYCAANGIIVGMGNDNFNPDGQLTATAFAKMLLVALGYDPHIEGFEGSDWSINTQKIANMVGLFNGNPSVVGSAAVTRDEAALYAFNAVCSPLVQYDSTVSVNVNGAAVVVGNNNHKYVTSVGDATRYTNIDDLKDNANRQANIVEFAEEYYQKLRRENDDNDVFGRPAHVWTYDKKDLGTFVNTSLLNQTYTGEFSGKTLYNLLGKSVVEDFTFTIYEDGVVVTSDELLGEIDKKNDDDWSLSGNGVLVEVFVDTDDEQVTIVVIHTYLALATADYNKKTESVSLKAYGVELINDRNDAFNGEYKFTGDGTATLKAEKEDFAIVEGAAEDDAFLVTIADKDFQTIVKAKVMEESTVTGFNKSKEKITVDGNQLSKAATAVYEEDILDKFTDGATSNLKDTTYDIYVDAYGNVIGAAEHDSVTNYAFVTAINDATDDNIAKTNAKANLIFLDGTNKIVEFDTKKSTGDALVDGKTVNTWVTYTVSNKDVYTLKQVANAIDEENGVKEAQSKTASVENEDDAIEIDSKHISLAGGETTYKKVYGNNNTVYLTADLDWLKDDEGIKVVIVGAENITTGVANANITTFTKTEQIEEADAAATATALDAVYTLYKSNGYVVAAIVLGDDASASKDIVYVKDTVNYESYSAKDDEWTWSLDAYKDGELVTIKEKGDSLDKLGRMAKHGWYEVGYNSDGYVVSVTALDNDYRDDDDLAYTSDYTELSALIGDSDTVIYQEARDTKPSLKGQTMYLDKANESGFRVDKNVKIVLNQTDNNKSKWTTYEGISELESILDSLNQDNGAYNFVLNAKIDDGTAKLIVIYDKATGNEDAAPAPAPVTSSYTVTEEDLEFTVTYDGEGEPDTTAGRNAIMNWLSAQGYKNIKVTVADGTYTFTADMPNNNGGTTEMTFTWAGFAE